MSHVLIAYDSRYGQTARIAERIADRLRSAGHGVTLCRLGQDAPPLKEADAVLLGAPLYAGRFRSPVTAFLRRHGPALRDRPSGFFVVSGSAASPTEEGRRQPVLVAERFLQARRWQPSRTASFAGAVPYTRYGLLTRWLMKSILKRAGGDTDTSRDYEYTDWTAVDRYADEFAGLLDQPARRPA